MNIAVFGGKIWERFCATLGAPEWVTDERFRDKAARSVNRDALNAAINAAPRRIRTAITGSNASTPTASPAATSTMCRRCSRSRRFNTCTWCRTSCPSRLGPQRLVGQPMQLERTPSRIARAAPRRGEHTEEILGELGFGAEDLARMKSSGVF